MAWTRIDDSFFTNHKIQAVGAKGMAMYVSSLVYCNTHETDGFIPNSVLDVIASRSFNRSTKAAVKLMVDAKLYLEVDGGYQINDFLKYNKSREEIKSLRQKRAEAGRQGGKGKKPKPEDNPDEANAKQPDEANAKQLLDTPKEQKPSINPKPLTLSPKKDLTTTTGVNAREKNNFQLYEEEIGRLSPTVREILVDAENEYSEGWVHEAILEAINNNVRKWTYIEAILKGWKQNGFKTDTRPKRTAGTTPRAAPVNTGLAAVKAMAAEQGIQLGGIFGGDYGS